LEHEIAIHQVDIAVQSLSDRYVVLQDQASALFDTLNASGANYDQQVKALLYVLREMDTVEVDVFLENFKKGLADSTLEISKITGDLQIALDDLAASEALSTINHDLTELQKIGIEQTRNLEEQKRLLEARRALELEERILNLEGKLTDEARLAIANALREVDDQLLANQRERDGLNATELDVNQEILDNLELRMIQIGEVFQGALQGAVQGALESLIKADWEGGIKSVFSVASALMDQQLQEIQAKIDAQVAAGTMTDIAGASAKAGASASMGWWGVALAVLEMGITALLAKRREATDLGEPVEVYVVNPISIKTPASTRALLGSGGTVFSSRAWDLVSRGGIVTP
jgi:hypothetical protein